MTKLVSPNQLHEAAKLHMLNGRDPVSKDDWSRCANFLAFNIEKGLEVTALPLLGMILEYPLTRDEMIKIAEYQMGKKP